MPPDIIVTAPLPPFLYDPLKADYRCHDYVQASDKARIPARRSGARYAGSCRAAGTVTPTTLLDALPALEIISVFGVGYDGVPVDYCRKRGLKVTNTPDVLTDDVADVAVGLVMMTGRGFVRLNRFVHAGDWLKRGPELTTKLAGKTVGILGLGRIGKAIAQRLSAMGMKIAYTGRKPQDVPYRFIPELKCARGGIGLSGRRVPGRRGDEEHRQRRSARGARQEGHARQHRARLDRRRTGARRGAREGHDQGRGARRVRRRAAYSAAAARDGQRRAVAARGQRDARDAAGDGGSLQGESRRVVRGQAAAGADPRIGVARHARGRAEALAEGRPVVSRAPTARESARHGASRAAGQWRH